MKKKAAIYARVSTSDKQDYQRQVNELKLIAFKDGYKEEDIETFAENVSGYKRDNERVKLQELQQKIEENREYFGCVYTSEISRIGRNPNHTRQVIDRWSELGVPLYIQSLNQSTLGSDGSRNMIMNIILQVLMEYANEEAKTFKTRSKSGLLNSARSGKSGGGRNLPYGYMKSDDKKLIINDKESQVIVNIFNLYRAGPWNKGDK